MRKVALESVAEIRGGGKLGLSGKDFVDDGYPAYGAGGVNGMVPEAEYRRPAVVLSSIGARCGKCFLAEGSWTSLANTQLILPDLDRVDLRFLWYQLNDESRWHRSGTGQPFIKPSDVKSHQVWVPPLDEQRRIAAILDHAQDSRAQQEEELRELDRFDLAAFLHLFGKEANQAVSSRADRVHHMGWKWLPLNSVATMATGHTPDRARADYWDGDIPWIALPDIRALDGRTCTSTALSITEAGLGNSSAVLLPTGTICFSRTASIGFVTKTGIPMATSQDFHNWTPGPDLDADYLMAALRVSRPHLLGSSDGSTHKTIYQRVAERFNILLPPIEMQRRFARTIAASDQLRAQAAGRALLLDELFLSLQSRAFSGQL